MRNAFLYLLNFAGNFSLSNSEARNEIGKVFELTDYDNKFHFGRNTDSRSLVRVPCQIYYPMLRLNGIAMYSKVISPRLISTSARGYIHLFIRNCKHLRAHTTRCVHKLCISTCAQCFIRASANQAAFRQDQNWSAGGDVGYTPWLGLTEQFAHLSK